MSHHNIQKSSRASPSNLTPGGPRSPQNTPRPKTRRIKVEEFENSVLASIRRIGGDDDSAFGVETSTGGVNLDKCPDGRFFRFDLLFRGVLFPYLQKGDGFLDGRRLVDGIYSK